VYIPEGWLHATVSLGNTVGHTWTARDAAAGGSHYYRLQQFSRTASQLFNMAELPESERSKKQERKLEQNALEAAMAAVQEAVRRVSLLPALATICIHA
jgi:hypothetical protein